MSFFFMIFSLIKLFRGLYKALESHRFAIKESKTWFILGQNASWIIEYIDHGISTVRDEYL